MINRVFCISLIFLNSYACFSKSNENKDSIQKENCKIILHHEIIDPAIYPLIIGGNNSALKVITWKYFTGGIRYRLKKNMEIGVDYLFFEKQVRAKQIGSEVPALFGSIVNPSLGYEAQTHTYQQKYMWMNFRKYFKSFFASAGIGGGTYSYKNNSTSNSVYEKNTDWCFVVDVGYKAKLYRNINLCLYLGMFTAFSPKKEVLYEKSVTFTADELYNEERRQFKDLKKVEIINSNDVFREYKYLGIMQSKLIPRLGVSLTVNL